MLLSTWQGREPTTAEKSMKRHSPKVRTGCVTCKMRRIKCDEGKPRCLKCTNGDRTCVFRAPELKMFVPAAGPPKAARRASGDIRMLMPRVVGQCYGSHEETLSLHIYLNRIAPFTSLYFSHPTLWTITLPCASWQNLAIKHSLVAATLADVNVTCGIVSENQISRASYHYNLAIRYLVGQDVKIESVISAGILIWLYEMMKGNAAYSKLHLVGVRQIISEGLALQATSRSETSSNRDSASPRLYGARKGSSPPEKATSDIESFMHTVDQVARECESYTDQLLGSSDDHSANSTYGPEVESPVKVELEHVALLTEWDCGTEVRTLTGAVKILEIFISYLAHGCTDGSLLQANWLEASAASEKTKISIAEAIVFLNRWFLAFRTYCAAQDKSEEGQVVLRLYQAVFAVVKLRLHHAVEVDNRNKERCRCQEKLSNVSEDVWRLLGEAETFPSISACVESLMRIVTGQSQPQT